MRPALAPAMLKLTQSRQADEISWVRSSSRFWIAQFFAADESSSTTDSSEYFGDDQASQEAFEKLRQDSNGQARCRGDFPLKKLVSIVL